jgi:DNA-binding transcriptional LysR family regulator
MLNLAHVRSFLAVVDTRGVRSAAKALALSPSTVVDHIKQLEQDIAEPLFVRARGGLSTTLQGSRLLPYARALVGTAMRVKDLVKQPLIRLSSSSNVGTYLLQPPLAEFRRKTGIEVELWVGPNPQVAERLERGEADVAVMEWWGGRAGFTVTPWLSEPLVVITPPEHPWAALEAIETEQLLEVSILGGEPGSGTARVLRDQLGPIADRLRTQSGYGSTEAVKRAVRAGHGISIVMRSAVADEVASGRLAALPIKGVPLAKEIKLVVADRLPSTSAAATFVADFAQRG